MIDDPYEAAREDALKKMQALPAPKSHAEMKTYLEVLAKLKPEEKTDDEENPLSVAVKEMIDGMNAQIYTQDMEDLCLENKELREQVKRLNDELTALRGG